MALGPRLALLALLAAGGALTATNCSELTELVVVVDTDRRGDLDQVDLTVAGQLRSVPLTNDTVLPLTLSVQAGGDPNAEVSIEAGGKLRGVVVVTATANVRLQEGDRGLVHLSLCRSCGAQCTPVNTTEAFTGAVPSAPRCDGVAPPDGDAGDAGADAPVVKQDCPGDPFEMKVFTTRTGARFCIDEREVTIRQYRAFLAAKSADASAQPPGCEWNFDYAKPLWPASPLCEATAPVFQLDPDTIPNHPMRCVDWCDARSYCEWRGKRLCGRIGDHATKLIAGELSSADVSEWYAACSNGGDDVYPSGDQDEDRDQCNVTLEATTETCSRAGCKTKLGVCDMVGNVFEWEDSCEPSDVPAVQGFGCSLRGGSTDTATDAFDRCSLQGNSRAFANPRAGQDDIGIRCCADPIN